MSQLSELIAAGQKFHARHLPATITINGQGYDCATTGLQQDRDLITGGWLDRYRIAFWLPLSAFTDAGQPVPEPRAVVTINTISGAAPPITQVVIADAARDGANATVTLRCASSVDR